MSHAHIPTNTEEDFVTASVTLLEGLINAAILEKDRCVLGLSGGSTPRPVYEALGKSEEIDWSKVWIFLVDERHVPEDDDESNTKLIQDTLMASAEIPPAQFIHPQDLPLEEWLPNYEGALAEVLGDGFPDVVVLGMGEDGHIASLFPPIPVAEDRDLPLRSSKGGFPLTIHTTTDQFAVHDRISVTLPVLTNAGAKIFLLKGEGKKKVWEEMEGSEEGVERWPAKAILESGDVSVVSQW